MKIGTFKEAWKNNWPVYVFIIITAISLLYRNRVHANYDHYQSIRHTEANRFEMSILAEYENEFEIRHVCKFYTMNVEYDQCTTFTEKRDFHRKNAERCLNDAKTMCFYLPSKVREKSFYAFSMTTSMAVPGDLRSKIVGCLITTLIEYGADCYEEWTNINTKLYWAQHHYEMYEFYSEVVRSGNS